MFFQGQLSQFTSQSLGPFGQASSNSSSITPTTHVDEARTESQRVDQESYSQDGRVNQNITFTSGQFAGHTVRAELCEIQKADLGRKYARVDRRPLDPPPVVELRLFHVTGSGKERELPTEDIQILGFVCTVDLFSVSGSSPLTSVPRHNSSPATRANSTSPLRVGHRRTQSSPLNVSIPSSSPNTMPQSPIYTFHDTGVASGGYQLPSSPTALPQQQNVAHDLRTAGCSMNLETSSSYSYIGQHSNAFQYNSDHPLQYSGPSTSQSQPFELSPISSSQNHYNPLTSTMQSQSPEATHVVHHMSNVPIYEGSKSTSALVGATFVQPTLIDWKGKKTLIFVFADLAVKSEGDFILRYRVFDIYSRTDGCDDLVIQAECFGRPFRVYSTKEFPGLQASTELTKLISRYGVRMNIRETERKRRPKKLLTESGKRKHSSSEEDDED